MFTKNDIIKTHTLGKEVAQWQNPLLACTRPWVRSLSPKKKSQKNKQAKNKQKKPHNTHLVMKCKVVPDMNLGEM
jgi:hypothetical protein